MTKEAKLDRAKRLLPEWTVYDDEARALFDEWKEKRRPVGGKSKPTIPEHTVEQPALTGDIHDSPTTRTKEVSPVHDEL